MIENITSCPVSTGGFIGAITDWLVGLMTVMGGLGTGVAVLLENLFPPIPSEVILPLAGFPAAQGHMTLFEAIIGALVVWYVVVKVRAHMVAREV